MEGVAPSDVAGAVAMLRRVRGDPVAHTIAQLLEDQQREVARWKYKHAVSEVARAEAEQAATYWRNTANALTP